MHLTYLAFSRIVLSEPEQESFSKKLNEVRLILDFLLLILGVLSNVTLDNSVK